MTGIIDWVKNYTMVFLLLSVISTMAAKKEYKRYIYFFVEMLLVISMVTPILQLLGKEEDFFSKISYDSFWQGLDGIRMDQEKLPFLDASYYIEQYEKMIASDVGQMVSDAGFVSENIQVKMTENYEVEKIYIEIQSVGENQIVVGDIFEKEISPELEKLQEEIALYYQILPEKIEITG